MLNSNFNLLTIFKSFKIGIKIGLRHWRAALIVYAIQFLFALTLGLQVYQVVEASIGSSLELNKLLSGYSETVVRDFLNVHGASLSPLLGELRYEIIVYALFSIFLNAGILSGIVRGEKRWKTFWKGGAEYFSRFFGNAVFFIVLTLIWAAVIWAPFIAFFPISADYVSSEKTSMYIMFVLVAVFLFGLFFFFNWSVVSRLKIISENKRPWQAIRSGFKIARRKYLSLTGLFLLFFLLEMILIGIYWWAEGASGMVTPVLVLIFFVVQQAFSFMRIVFRIMMYGGVNSLLKN